MRRDDIRPLLLTLAVFPLACGDSTAATTDTDSILLELVVDLDHQRRPPVDHRRTADDLERATVRRTEGPTTTVVPTTTDAITSTTTTTTTDPTATTTSTTTTTDSTDDHHRDDDHHRGHRH